MIEFVIVVGCYMVGFLSHDMIADLLARRRGKIRVVSVRSAHRKSKPKASGPVGV